MEALGKTEKRKGLEVVERWSRCKVMNIGVSLNIWVGFFFLQRFVDILVAGRAVSNHRFSDM